MSAVITGDQNGTVGLINAKTAVASTSGTSIDFTSIPAGVKRITVMFSGVSTSGTSNILVQLGAGSVTTTGYLSTGIYAGGTNQSAGSSSTAGMLIYSTTAANLSYGHMLITNSTGNTWVASHSLGLNLSGAVFSFTGGGNVALGGTLDRVRITTVNGTDTFDAGSINILYE